MKKFLEPTIYCDSENPLIIQKAVEIKKGIPLRPSGYAGQAEKQSAIAVWEFISTIPYRFDFWSVKASETLAKGQGMCTNKANLQIAILRAMGIPSAYGVMKIRKETFLGICRPEFYDKIKPITIHVFCYVYLDGRWIASDATPDRSMVKGKKWYGDARRFAWNGENHHKKNPKYVVSEGPMVANLDNKLSLKPRFLTPEVIAEANSHIDKLAEERREK